MIWILLTIMFFFYALEIYPFWDAINYAAHSSIPYAIIFYGNALWLMPRLYRRKKYFLYFVGVFLMLVIVTIARIQSEMYIWFHFIIHKPFEVQLRTYYYGFIIDTLFYIFSIAYRFTLDYFQIKRQQDQLLKQHAEAQLNLLKAQVQPHFLFNTLNNIYFVAQRESPLTADLIEKLSSIMRYFLEQGPKEEITLNAELDFIRNYIELEKMRIRYPVQTSIDIIGDTANVKIPPMLLIPLVENVFKHGIDKRASNNYLSIRLEIPDRLHFKVSNRIHNDPAQYSKGWGIGLNNLSKRLSILYGGNFVLESDHSEDMYTSHLIIPL
jgi:sensor histidine kinase YesM